MKGVLRCWQHFWLETEGLRRGFLRCRAVSRTAKHIPRGQVERGDRRLAELPHRGAE